MYNAKYEWEEWFAKGKITLREGKHYEKGVSFAQQIRNAASRLGFKITLKELPNRFIVTVVGEDGKPVPKQQKVSN